MRARRAALRPAIETSDVAALARFVAASPEGERNARLFWAACRAGAAAEALTPAAIAAGLPPTEATATIRSAMQTAGKAGQS
jgi:hypothetical protein